MDIDLTSLVDHLFHHNPTYSGLDIAWRITEDYNIEHFTLTARFVERIRLEHGWLRTLTEQFSNRVMMSMTKASRQEAGRISGQAYLEQGF